MKEMIENLSLTIRARFPILYLLTWEEDRAEQALREIGKTAGKQVYAWSLSQGLVPRTSETADCSTPEEALQFIGQYGGKAIFILKDFHVFMEKEMVVRRLRDLAYSLKRSYKTIVLLSPTMKIPRELEKDVTVFDLPLPNAGELTEVLNNLLAPYRSSKDVKISLSPEGIEKIVQATLGLTRNEAENVYAKALLRDREFSEQDLPEIIKEKQQLIRKSGILDFIGHSAQMTHVGGLDHLKDWLRQRAAAFSSRARQYGLPAPKGLLMVGVQGCGKSLAAKAIAAEWNLPLLRLDVGQIFDSFIGNSEANMRKAIAVAEAMSPTVFWVDEIEKGFSGIQSSGATDAGVTARIFGTFLTWMQEKTSPVFIIATANNIEQLPPEMLRKGRFDDIFFVDLPNQDERREIFRIHLSLKKRDPGKYDLGALAHKSMDFSGAEIEQAVVSAMYKAFPRNREFDTKDIVECIEETVPLAVTAREKISALREWAGQRARPASRPG